MTRNRRRQIVVNKELQSRIVFATAWAPALCLAGTSLLLGVFCARLYKEALQADVSLPSILPVFAIAMCFMLVATAYMLFSALRFSHRIAGPMYNVGKTLQRFRDGDINARIILRQHDYLVEVQDYMNAFLDWLQECPPKDYVAIDTDESSGSADAGDTKGAEDATAADSTADAGESDSAEADSADAEAAKTTAGS